MEPRLPAPFQLFRELMRSGAIYPDEHDYRQLGVDRTTSFFELAREQAAAGLRTAITRPGTILTVQLGHPLGKRSLPVRIAAHRAGIRLRTPHR